MMKNKNILLLAILLVVGCQTSSLKVNPHVEHNNWNNLAIMPVSGQYAKLANDKLTYLLGTNRKFKLIIPQYLVGDIQKIREERNLNRENLALLNIVANKYNADAFVHTEVSSGGSLDESEVVVFIKVIDTTTNQVFAVSKNQGSSIFSKNQLVSELLEEGIREINLALNY